MKTFEDFRKQKVTKTLKIVSIIYFFDSQNNKKAKVLCKLGFNLILSIIFIK